MTLETELQMPASQAVHAPPPPTPPALQPRSRFIPRLWLRNGWTVWHPLLLVILSVLGVLATLDAWQDIYRIAMKDEESSHIFLVPIVIAWLIWVRRGRFRRCRPVGGLIGLAFILAGVGGLLPGRLLLCAGAMAWRGGAGGPGVCVCGPGY